MTVDYNFIKDQEFNEKKDSLIKTKKDFETSLLSDVKNDKVSLMNALQYAKVYNQNLTKDIIKSVLESHYNLMYYLLYYKVKKDTFIRYFVNTLFAIDILSDKELDLFIKLKSRALALGYEDEIKSYFYKTNNLDFCVIPALIYDSALINNRFGGIAPFYLYLKYETNLDEHLVNKVTYVLENKYSTLLSNNKIVKKVMK